MDALIKMKNFMGPSSVALVSISSRAEESSLNVVENLMSASLAGE